MELVYHYTSIDVLYKLLDGIIIDKLKTNFVFHASSLLVMNDPHEFIRGYDILWKELPSIEKAAGIKEGKYKISTIWKSISSGKKDVDRNKMLLDALFDNNKTPFVVCFSKQRD